MLYNVYVAQDEKTVDQERYRIGELSQITGVEARTIRYYVQQGLLAAPMGAKRGSYYTKDHLRNLLQIVKCRASGWSLDATRQYIESEDRLPPVRLPQPGTVRVMTRVVITEGVELEIDSERAGLSPAQTRSLCKAVIEAHKSIKR